jgi:hypothetical protein
VSTARTAPRSRRRTSGSPTPIPDDSTSLPASAPNRFPPTRSGDSKLDLATAIQFLDDHFDDHPWSLLVSPPQLLAELDHAIDRATRHQWHRIAIDPQATTRPGPAGQDER